jgi:hypothetical protein
VKTQETEKKMHSTMASFATDHVQPYFYPPTIPEHHHYHRNSRRSSTATYSGNKSSRSIGDRRRSSGALSTYSQSQKPRKCIGEYVVGKTLGKGASGRVYKKKKKNMK